MERKIGISIGELQRKHGDLEALRVAKALGADAVDISLEAQDYRREASIYSKDDAEIRAYYEGLRDRAQALGLEISQTHGRIEGFRNIPAEDDALVDNARRDLLATAALGAPVCVMHTATTIYLGPDADPKLMHQLSFDQFTRILPHARTYGVKVATETFGDATGRNCCDFFGNIKEFLITFQRISAVEDFADWFRICIDTGHSNKATRYNNNPAPADVIRMCGKDIAVLHLHDNDTLTDQHKMPLTGTIDWNDVFDALDEVGYHNVYNMELYLGHFGPDLLEETAAFGIKVLRSFLDRRDEKKN